MKINSYINPFSNGFIQTTKDFHFLKKHQQVIAVALSALTGLLTLPFFGVGGYATFHALVDAFKPLKKGENPTADKTFSSAQKTTSSAQKTFAKGGKVAGKGKDLPVKKIRQALAGTADIDAQYSYKGEKGFTALMIALDMEDFDSAKELIGRADVNFKSERNKTALSIVLNVIVSVLYYQKGKGREKKVTKAKELFSLILAKCDAETLNLRSQQGGVPLFNACMVDLETVRALVEKGAQVNPKATPPPINAAISTNNREIVEYLFDQGAQFNSRHSDTSLGIAMRRIKDSAPRLEMVTLLLNRGADVNERILLGLTPLHYAIIINDIELVKLLIGKGANLDRPLSEDYLSEFTKGTTPLKLAELNGFIEIENLLIAEGATQRTGGKLIENQAEYDLLGLTPGASRDEILRESRRLIAPLHPDSFAKQLGETDEAAAIRKTENEAQLKKLKNARDRILENL